MLVKGPLGITEVWAYLNTVRTRQNGHNFADIFKCIFLNRNVCISINISLKFVPKGQINNIQITKAAFKTFVFFLFTMTMNFPLMSFWTVRFTVHHIESFPRVIPNASSRLASTHTVCCKVCTGIGVCNDGDMCLALGESVFRCYL